MHLRIKIEHKTNLYNKLVNIFLFSRLNFEKKIKLIITTRNNRFTFFYYIFSDFGNIWIAMEIFIKVKKMLRLIGVLEFDHRHSKMIQCFLIIFGFVITTLFVLSALWFFCFDANTFIEEVECFLALNSALHMYTLFLMLMQQRKASSEIIMKMEAGINKCKNSIIQIFLSIG